MNCKRQISAWMIVLLFSLGTMLSTFSQTTDPDIKISVLKQNFPSQITGIAISPKGLIYVAAGGSQPIKNVYLINGKLDLDTICRIECFGIPFLKYAFDNTLYASVILERGKNNASILKIAPDKSIIKIAEGFIQPVGITFDSKNNLYVIDAMQKKVFKISSDNKKSQFIDLEQFPISKEILYHGIDFNIEKNRLFISGISITGGTGNLLKFDINDNGQLAGAPTVIFNGNCKHVISSKNMIIATINTSSLLIKDLNSGSTRIIDDKLLLNAMTLSPGVIESGDNNIYLNAFDKIVKVSILHK